MKVRWLYLAKVEYVRNFAVGFSHLPVMSVGLALVEYEVLNFSVQVISFDGNQNTFAS